MTLEDLPPWHDLSHLDCAIEFVTDFRLALDVGAHRGIWTRRMRQRFDRVVSVEPVAENRNHIGGTDVIAAAVSDRPGWVQMRPGTENTGQWHIDPDATNGDVQVITIDSLGLNGLGFMKLDVEGMELAAIMGALATIERERPVICLEVNGLHRRYGTADGQIEAQMRSLGYHQVAQFNKDQLWMPSPSPAC